MYHPTTYTKTTNGFHVPHALFVQYYLLSVRRRVVLIKCSKIFEMPHVSLHLVFWLLFFCHVPVLFWLYQVKCCLLCSLCILCFSSVLAIKETPIILTYITFLFKSSKQVFFNRYVCVFCNTYEWI